MSRIPDPQEKPTVLCEGRFARLLTLRGWEYVERPHSIGAVAMVAVTPEGRLVLIEQYRIPVRRAVIELPAGLVGDQEGHSAESIEQAARRELLEETGYQVSSIRRLGGGPPSAGLSAETVELVLAEGLVKTGPGGGDPSEAITVHEVPLPEVDAWLHQQQAQGQLIDPKIFAGLYLLGRAQSST